MVDQVEDKIFEAVEVARNTGKIKKGINEVTKAIEKGSALLVVYAKDVNPPEVVMHLEPLCKEKEIKCTPVSKREELGTAAGIPVSTAAVAVVDAGDAKKLIDALGPEKKAEEKKE